MLSLDNAFSDEEVAAFDRRLRERVGMQSETIEYVAEPKLDGLAVSLTYQQGILALAATRGTAKSRGRDAECADDLGHPAASRRSRTSRAHGGARRGLHAEVGVSRAE